MKRTLFALVFISFMSGSMIGIAAAQDTPAAEVPTVEAITPTPVPEVTAQPPVIIVEPPPVPAPDPSPAPSPTDGAGAALVLLLALVGALNRFVEMLKPAISATTKSLGLNEAAYDAVVVGVSVVIGVVMVLVSNQSLNLFAGLPLVPPIIGTVLTGAAAGFGAGAVQAVFDLVSGATGTLSTVQKSS